MNLRFFWGLLPVVALLAIQPTGAKAAVTLHVAPNGDDTWSGNTAQPTAGDGPLRTLAAAQRLARKALAANTAGGVRVLIEPGVYVLDEPLEFVSADSGTAAEPMVYEAAIPGTVTFSGGRVLDAQAASTSPTQASFASPNTDAAFWAGAPQFYVNGRRAVLAREPDLGTYWHAGQPVAVPGEAAASLGHEAFRAAPEALAFVQRLSTTDRERALLHIMQSWSSGRHRLAPAAPEGALRVSPRSRWPFLFFGASQRFYVENVAAAMDQPGEWIGSPAGVRYLPRTSDTQPLNAVLPMLERLVVVRGAGPAGPYVQHLELRGLAFEYTRSSTPAAGWVDNQAAVDIGAAIEVDHARGFKLTGCRVSQTGAHAVWFRDGVRDSAVTGCTMDDLGGGGVKIGNPKAATSATDTQATGANTVARNRISHTGRQYPGAAAVWLGPTFDNEVSQNTITDTTYTAISVGWQWGYTATTSGRNRIAGNALLRVGGGTLADLGGIYTLGPSPGTVITGNLVREVRGYKGHGAGAWGIYNDEGSSDLTVADNVVAGTDSGAYHLHYGRNLLLQGNLFALGDEMEVSVTRSDPGRTRLALRDNLLVTGSALPFAAFARPPDAEFSGNLVAPLHAGQAPDLRPCGGGCSKTSATLIFGPGPQQLALGGLPAASARRWADIAAMAGAGSASGAAQAAAQVGSAVVEASAAPGAGRAPALNAALDLAGTPDSARPPGWRYFPATPASAIGTVADASAPGGRCLQLLDSASLAQRFEPYLFTRLNHEQGHSTARFAVRVDAAGDFVHEWRDDANPARTGPSLRITRAGVEAGGRVVAPVQPGQWLQISVSAALAGSGAWDLQVTDAAGKTTTARALPPKNPGWQSLRWLGFISNASVDTLACLAEVRVTNEAR
jgi:hypothetical protein